MARIYTITGLTGQFVFVSDAAAEAQYPGRWAFVAEVVEPPKPRHITRLAFLSRFTDAEAVAIDLASIGATVQAASMRRYMQKVNNSSYIDLDRPDTRSGVQALEAGGVLTAGRAAIILDAPVQDSERPQ